MGCVFSYMLFQYCSVSSFGGVVLIVFPCYWEYTIDGLVEYSWFIVLPSNFLVYLFKLL